MKKLALALALIFLPINVPFTRAQIDNSLISQETQIDYQPLEQLLAEQEWQQANQKTFALMLKAANRDSQGWIEVDGWQNFPCEDLQIINNLWERYSSNRFGFTPQLEIFLETGNIPGSLRSERNYERFGDEVGWRRDGEWILFIEDLQYNLDAPVGHLPNPRYEYEVNGGRLKYTNFAKRSVECNLIQLPPQPQPSPSPSPVIEQPNLEI